MKPFLALLALCFLLSGCSANMHEGNVKTRAKQASNASKNKSGLEKLGQNKQDIVLFLDRAEHLTENLQFAAASLSPAKSILKDGVTYRKLPKKWESKDSIIDYFARYWSSSIAENMYKRLPVKEEKKKVYLAAPKTDYPMLISLRNTTFKTDSKGITAVVTNATLPDYASERTITYRLERDPKTERYKITKRSGAYGKEKYE